MATLKSLRAVGRTSFNLNGASSFYRSKHDDASASFDISESWETELNLDSDHLDKELRLNDCKNVIERSLIELSQGNCVLYNSQELNRTDETNTLQETDDLKQKPGNEVQNLEYNTEDSMAPTAEAYFKSIPTDISAKSTPVIKEPQKTLFNHLNKSTNICDWTDSALSPPKSLHEFIANNGIRITNSKNITEPDININEESVINSNENFSGKSLSELAECQKRLDECSESSSSSSGIDVSTPSSLSSTDENYVHDTSCELLNSTFASIIQTNDISSKRRNEEHDYISEVKNFTSDLKSLTEEHLSGVVFDIELNDSASQSKLLQLKDNSNVTNIFIPESLYNSKQNIESTEDKDISSANSLQSVAENYDVKSFSNSPTGSKINLSGCILPNKIETESRDLQQLSENYCCKLDDENFNKTSYVKQTSTDDSLLKDALTDIKNKEIFINDSNCLNGESDLLDLLLGEEGFHVSKFPTVEKNEDVTSSLDSSFLLSSNLDSEPLNGDSHLFDLLSEGKNGSFVSELSGVAGLNVSSLLNSSQAVSSSRPLSNEVDLFDSLLSEERDNLLVSKSSSGLISSKLDSKPLNGDSHLFDFLSEGKNGSVVSELSSVAGLNLSSLLNSSQTVSSPRPLDNEVDLFDSLLSEEKDSLLVSKSSSGIKNGNLSASNIVSLSDLADNHLLNNELDKNCLGEAVAVSKNNHDSFSFGSFENILLKEKSNIDFNIIESCSELNNEAIIFEDFAEKLHFKGSVTRNKVPEEEKEADIDLNFCIRSPVTKDNYLTKSSDSESKDSGFDETDLETLKSIIPTFQVSESGKKQENETFKNVLQKKRPSLISIAISCELNLEKSRRNKLKEVRKKLLKCSFPVTFANFTPENFKFEEKSRNISVKSVCSSEENIADHFDECYEVKNHMVFLGQ